MGYKRENVEKLKNMYDIDLSIVQDIKFSPDKIEVIISKKYRDFKDDNEAFSDRKGRRVKSKIEKDKKKIEEEKAKKDNNE